MKEKVSNILFVFLLGAISTSLLLGIRAYTAPVIKQNEEIKFKTTVLSAAGIENIDKDKLDAVFSEKIKKGTSGNFTYFITKDNFYIIEFSGQGLWGPIKGFIALNSDLQTIKRVKILSQEETPGLGGRIGEEEFLNLFAQKKINPKLYLALRQKAVKDTEVDAISGATLSSQALLDTINNSAIKFKKAMENK